MRSDVFPAAIISMTMFEDAELDRDGWELVNAVQYNREHPSQFHIPSESERQNLKPGRRVKLVFLLNGEDETGPFVQGERMWLKIIQVTDLRYVGRLESKPATSKALRPGDCIAFGPEHIATILVPLGFNPWNVLQQLFRKPS